METIKTSNLWAASWAVYRGVPIAGYSVVDSHFTLVELDNRDGQAQTALSEWFNSNPVAPVRALIDIRSEMIRTAKRTA